MEYVEPTTSDGSNTVGHLYGWQPLIAGLPARVVSDEFQKQATSTSLSLTEEDVKGHIFLSHIFSRAKA